MVVLPSLKGAGDLIKHGLFRDDLLVSVLFLFLFFVFVFVFVCMFLFLLSVLVCVFDRKQVAGTGKDKHIAQTFLHRHF